MHLLAVQPHQCKYGIRATNNGISVPSSFRSNPSSSNVHNCRPVLTSVLLVRDTMPGRSVYDTDVGF